MSNGTAVKAFDEGDAQQSVQARAESRPPLEGSWGLLSLGGLLGIISSTDDLPPWGTPSCDAFLRKTLHTATVFSGVVYGESTRAGNTQWVLNSENETRLKRYQQMFATCDFGGGFSAFRKKIATDLLTQNNGAFIELIGPGGDRNTESPLSEVESFAHLDAAQCYRTFSPEFPIIYLNPYTGGYHIMHWSRVICMSQFPQPYELGRGMGMCALYRAYEAGRTILATNTYIYEKVTGGSEDLYMTNIPMKQLETALLSSRMKNEASQLQVYRDPMILAPLSGGVGAPDLRIESIAFKSLPDGFDHEKELTLSMYMVAMGFGVDAREYWPSTSSGATRADAEIQDLKAESKGITDILNMIEEALNWRVLPEDVTFEFRKRNSLTEKREAENRMIRAQTRSTQVLSGELSVEEARQMAAEADDIKPEFLIQQTSADDSEAVNADNTGMVEGEIPEDVIQESKAYTGVRDRFIQQLRGLVHQMNVGVLDAGAFIHAASDVLQTSGIRAFIEGIQDGGAPQISTIGQLEPEERSKMQVLINDQVGFLSNLSRDFEASGTDAPIITQRVELWANKGLDGIYYGGVMAGQGNPAMEWFFGQTEQHCEDCANYHGRVYRKKTWDKYEIAPRSSLLGCKGYLCDCSLKISKKPITPGRPPKPAGMKSSEWHRRASHACC